MRKISGAAGWWERWRGENGKSREEGRRKGSSEKQEWPKDFWSFWHGEEELCIASWARWKAQRKDKSGNTNAEQKDEIFKNAIHGRLRVQDRASERLQDQIIEEIKELEHRKTQEALQWVRTEHDLWMYQNEKEEAKRRQGARKLRNVEEMAWAQPRNISKWPDWEEARERGKKVNGGWSLKVKRKCRKSLSCRMRWMALSWIWIVKAIRNRRCKGLQKRKRNTQQGRGHRKSKKESDSGGIRRNTWLCERSKEYGIWGRGREDLCTERGERSIKALCFVVTVSAATKTLSCWQLADEGDEASTTNLCQKCFNKHFQTKGEKPLKRAVETGGGRRRRIVEECGNDGKRTIFAWDEGIFSPRKKQSKEVSRAGRRRKVGRNTTSMAAGIASHRVLGTSEMLPWYGWWRKGSPL